MTSPPPPRPAYGPWFLNPKLALCLGALLVTTAEILLRHGAQATKELADSTGLPGVSGLASWWVWLGILAYILSFACWLHVLRFLPLYLAFALMSVTQALVPLGAWYFLHETIRPMQWAGILTVLTGIAVIAKPLMNVEDKL